MELIQLHCACRLRNKLIHQIELNADPSQPPGNRKAATFALIRSNLLHLCTHWQGPTSHGPELASHMQLSLRGWTVAVALLEDEDEAVRCSSLPFAQPLRSFRPDTANAIVWPAGYSITLFVCSPKIHDSVTDGYVAWKLQALLLSREVCLK